MFAEINEIRELFLNHLNKSPDHFHPDDVERIKSYDWIISGFLEYQKILHYKTDVNATTKKLIEAMKWRREQGVNQLKESDFPMEYYQCGGLFLCKLNLILFN